MKKHWKKIVLVLAVLMLSVAGYLVYLFEFKEYDVADDEVDEITKERYEIELPDGSKIILDEEGNLIEDDGSGEGSGGSESAAGNGSGSGSGSDGGSGDGSGDDADGSTSNGTNGSGQVAGVSGSNNSSGGSGSGSGSGGSNSGGSASAGGGSSGAGGSGGSAGGSDGGNSSGGGSTGGSGGSGGSGGDSSGGTVTVAQIKQKYQPAMTQLEDQANARINGLISRAANEYSTKKANGESISYSYFYSKYTSAAAEAESRTDAVFYGVLNAMKSELRANGLAESHANTFVEDYEARKSARKSELLNKATSGF